MIRKFVFLSLISICSTLHAADLIVNEFNAVGSEKYLKTELYPDSTNVDVYFQEMAEGLHPSKLTGILINGRIQGNGSDWIELVVARDHLDVRGWQIRWAETDKTEANEANGTDLWYGDGLVEQGILTFSQDPFWSDLRKGTIITVVEEHTIRVDKDNNNRTEGLPPSLADGIINMGTDLSFDPAAADWWINVSIRQEMEKTDPQDRLMASVHNVLAHQVWDFGVGNDNWQVRIMRGDETLVWGPAGEALSPAGWGGGGVNSREAGRVEKDPSPAITGADMEDADTSSFGMPNRWGTPEKAQNFNPLRAWYYQPSTCSEALALGFGNPFDVVADCYVNLADFAVFAENWLACIDPANVNCDKPWLQ